MAGEPIALSISAGVSFEVPAPSGKWIQSASPARFTCSPATARAWMTSSAPVGGRPLGDSSMQPVGLVLRRLGEGIGGRIVRPLRRGADDHRRRRSRSVCAIASSSAVSALGRLARRVKTTLPLWI